MDGKNDRTALNTGESGILYVVATPIGNMADITFRAVQTLKEVALIAAEDTRHTKRLMEHYAIRNKMISFHEHNEKQRTGELLERLEKGDSIAIVSDAGTPTLSDPGYRLIKAVASSDIHIVPIPGPSAAVASLSVSGLPTDAYVFVGFLPRKAGKRQTLLDALVDERKTIIFYESPRRIKALIGDLIETLGDRPGVLSREMTKRHEEFIRGPLSEILHELTERRDIKGECTLVVKGAEKKDPPGAETLREEIVKGLHRDGIRLSDLVKNIANRHGLPKKQVYAEALRIKSSHDFSGRDSVAPNNNE